MGVDRRLVFTLTPIIKLFLWRGLIIFSGQTR